MPSHNSVFLYSLEFFPCRTTTGESDYDKPRILEVAEVVQNMDKLEEGKQLQEKAIKKGKESEMNARKMEVALNETRCNAHPEIITYLQSRHTLVPSCVFRRQYTPLFKNNGVVWVEYPHYRSKRSYFVYWNEVY